MMGVYLRSKGLGATEIALLGCSAQLLAAVARTAIAFLADRTGLHRPVCFILFELMTMLYYCTVLLVLELFTLL